MISEYASFIRVIRQFNRFYTTILGLLDQHLLHSDFSLSEARVLYELGATENCTAKDLIEELKIDAGYLSRMMKRFEKDGLAYRIQCKDDGRSYHLHLTEKGKDILAKLSHLSDAQICEMAKSLPGYDQEKVARSMMIIERILSRKAEPVEKRIAIRNTLQPGDVGELIKMHGSIYYKECGYNFVFEGYVCQTFADFFEKYSPDKDKFWFAELDDEIVGAIAIVGHSPERAQLRWFILHPEYRGKGIGNTLLQNAIKFCIDKNYRYVYLETTEDQKKAIKMYEAAGFRKIGEHENNLWGVHHNELTMEVDLST